MSELDAIKARRDTYYPGVTQREGHIIDDLDRAIAIAEEHGEAFRTTADEAGVLATELAHVEKERDEARAAIIRNNDAYLDEQERLLHERDKARAAVLALRDALNHHVVMTRLTADTERALMDTQSYEVFR